MSLFFRRPVMAPAVEDRSIQMPPSYLQSVAQSFGSVDASTGTTSLQSVAVRSTSDLIASLVSELPADVYRNGRKVRGPLPDSVADPGGDNTGREDWLYRLMMSFLVRGNAYGMAVDWDATRGVPKAVDLLHPDDVRPVDIPGGGVRWYVNGQPVEGADLQNFKHWRVNPVAGKLLGLSPVALHATTIGVSLRAGRFADQFFADGAHPSGLLVNEKPLNRESAAAAKAMLVNTIRGTREPLVLGQGWDYKPIQVTPEESQFLETQAFTEAQCARMFGPGFAEVMGYESGGSMTYANVVDRRQDLLVLSMNKWIRRADRILTALLPPSTLTVRLDRDALLEATTLQRYQTHELALQNRWRTINEVRAIEDLEPVAWGDEPNQTNNAQGVSSGNAAQS